MQDQERSVYDEYANILQSVRRVLESYGLLPAYWALVLSIG